MVTPDMQRIRHIQRYCQRIGDSIQRFGNDYDVFCADFDFYDAVCMRMMQIGELCAGLSEEFKQQSAGRLPWAMIKGMRNMFAHKYTAMDKEIIWNTALNDIPKLLAFSEDTLAREEGAP